MLIARHFSAGNGYRVLASPGRLKLSRFQPSLRDFEHFSSRVPALKCRAITTASLRDAPSLSSIGVSPVI